jgi:hypothetical protein
VIARGGAELHQVEMGAVVAGIADELLEYHSAADNRASQAKACATSKTFASIWSEDKRLKLLSMAFADRPELLYGTIRSDTSPRIELPL